ncbi:metallophosphoesterase [Bacillus sp. DTU_2020_1000418_1_SI_GHA_SEK_038]|uniref:metallophosphoesterase n=1 Tax=Bacillus sp. DTU_2020_1000418_1_SI_GHA_SEK_038 TaxID=3077585 RepID=UPI0028E275D6|nr:metallophosphoesterase [Bacillus sp. DTU_2020_1000418_1_SI_GHA_SEK_038]WNS75061.1 metallophosphoesterase [Bacillus sp. DTU_2020_1000418_1_SI_GHA_SEK_038]
MSFISAIVIFFAIYTAISFYVGYNGWVWLNSTRLRVNKFVYIGVIVFVSISMFIGRFSLFSPMELIGYLWLVIIGYGLILLPVANLLIYLLKKKGIFWIGLTVIAIFIFIFAYGLFNAWSPVVKTYDIQIDKEGKEENVKILMASDLHIGQIVGEKHLQRLVDLAENIQPDIILIPGDIIDDFIDPYLEKNMGKTLANLRAPLGVYAVPGNHDYYGSDLEVLGKELEKAGIHMLEDETVFVHDLFYLVGRNDLTDDNRKEVKELVKGLDHKKPIIMLDHQPKELDIAEQSGIDLVLSGHTHRGQMAPANLITEMIFENDWGHLQKESLHSIVSSGFGTWGPPLRIGSRAEVVVINLTFKSEL